MKWCVILLCVAAGLVSATSAGADTVKLKNGSVFDGRILEEKEATVSVQLKVGVVDFKRDEIEELVYAPEEENLKLESEWAGSTAVEEETQASDASATESERALVDDYGHEGKVKYEGRWITKEAYDVIQRENEIKQKRLRYQQEQDKVKKEQQLAAEQAAAKTAASSDDDGKSEDTTGTMKTLGVDRPFGIDDGSKSFSSKVRKFGASGSYFNE